jgi:RNA polymerase sigma factor (sigma-70 family)
MTNPDPTPVARQLRKLLAGPLTGGLSDAELLERFVAHRDEAAFEVLVWRHGPMVLGVCRHVLRHQHDAEDAFQATFLVLARKAWTIGKRQAVGSWLYRVAYRVALRAKLVAGKRAAKQTGVTNEPVAPPAPDPAWGDLRPVLDDEINRLPEKYRAPFVLCYLDGKTNEEAARELGCPKGTVLSRLAWARQRLRVRLTRRGLDLSVGGVVPALVPNLAALVLPTPLVDSTLKAALSVAARQSVRGAASGSVAALTTGVLQTMLWTKIKIVAGCALAVAVLAVGGVLTRQALDAGQPQATADKGEPPPKAEKSADKPDKPDAPKADEKTYAFEMRDKPWAAVFEWYAEASGLGYTGTFKPTGTFTFISPKGKKYTLADITDIINEALLSQKFLLVRRDTTFSLLPADEKPDPILVPRIRLDELPKRGKTELVSVVLPMTRFKAKDVAPEIKNLLGTFGEVVVLERANQLVLQDLAGNLRQVRQTLKEMEDIYAEQIRQSQKITEAEKQKWLDAQKKLYPDQ